MKLRGLCILVLMIFVSHLYSQSWKELNPPPNIFNEEILSVVADLKGNIYAAGKFKNLENKFVVAKWDGQHWLELGSGSGALNANNFIYCLAVDTMGNLYAAGGFTNSTGYTSIAKWDGTKWSEVGGLVNALNPNGYIHTMTIDVTGNLFVAGSCTDTSGNGYVARWNGMSWSQLGVGSKALRANGYIYSLTTDSTGNVYAAGHFTNSKDKYYVAKWNGMDWEELGGVSSLDANGYITCVKTDTNGNVYAGGGFTDSTGEYYIAKWNGTNWSVVGNGTDTLRANGPFNTIAISQNGNIYAGGYGTNMLGNTNVIKWDGNRRVEIFNVGYSTDDAIRAIFLNKDGSLYASGNFKNAGGHRYIAKWDGITMQELGFQGEHLQANNGINKIVVDSKGFVYAAGNFVTPGSEDYYIARWNGKTWSRLEGKAPDDANNGNYPVLMATDLSGNLYVTGHFTNSNGKYYIAKWDGNSWSELGDANYPVKIFEPLTFLTSDKKGNIYAAGTFGDSLGYSYGIIKWDGHRVSDYAYYNGNLCSLIIDSVGNIYAGNTNRDENGKYYVEKISGNSISRVGEGANALNSASKITALALDGKGNLLASGYNNEGYSKYNEFVAKWDGTTWSKAGSGEGQYKDGYVSSMVSDDSGNVYAASSTISTGAQFSVAKWDGSTWNEFGESHYFDSNIASLAIDTNGNIYAAGIFGNGRFQFVAINDQGKANKPMDRPMLSVLADQYCIAAELQTTKITNLPDTIKIIVSVKLDNINLQLRADSSFEFNPSILSIGQHQIKVTYISYDDSAFLIKNFEIIAASTPVVKLASTTLSSVNNDPVVLSAENVSGGGNNPKFTFTKDRNLNVVLQKESYSHSLTLKPEDLLAGGNWVYVTMRTSDSCYINQTSIDSISIWRAAPRIVGIVDTEYPDQKIYPYPNPISKAFRITGLQPSKNYTVYIANSKGATIFQRAFSNSTEMNLKEITQPGIYWITVYDNSKNRKLGSVPVIKY